MDRDRDRRYDHDRERDRDWERERLGGNGYKSRRQSPPREPYSENYKMAPRRSSPPYRRRSRSPGRDSNWRERDQRFQPRQNYRNDERRDIRYRSPPRDSRYNRSPPHRERSRSPVYSKRGRDFSPPERARSPPKRGGPSSPRRYESPPRRPYSPQHGRHERSPRRAESRRSDELAAYSNNTSRQASPPPHSSRSRVAVHEQSAYGSPARDPYSPVTATQPVEDDMYRNAPAGSADVAPTYPGRNSNQSVPTPSRPRGAYSSAPAYNNRDYSQQHHHNRHDYNNEYQHGRGGHYGQFGGYGSSRGSGGGGGGGGGGGYGFKSVYRGGGYHSSRGDYGSSSRGEHGSSRGDSGFSRGGFRSAGNGTSTTYPRTQRFDSSGAPIAESPTKPSHPSSGGNHSSTHTVAFNSKSQAADADDSESYLADVPSIVSGGQKLPPRDPASDSKIRKLEEEAERLRAAIAEKQTVKRAKLKEWNRMQSDTDSAKLKGDFAEENLAKVVNGGDGK